MLLLRLPGSLLLRLAARAFLALLFHDPPRNRAGSSAPPRLPGEHQFPEDPLPQAIGVAVTRMGAPSLQPSCDILHFKPPIVVRLSYPAEATARSPQGLLPQESVVRKDAKTKEAEPLLRCMHQGLAAVEPQPEGFQKPAHFLYQIPKEEAVVCEHKNVIGIADATRELPLSHEPEVEVMQDQVREELGWSGSRSAGRAFSQMA